VNGLQSLYDAIRPALVEPNPIAVGIVGWMIALVLGGAGVAKLRSRERFAATLVDFGVVGRPRVSAAIAVGLTELLLAVGLLVPSSAAAAAVAVQGMVTAILELIARSLRRGLRFACGCFGAWEEEISARTLLRTGLLAALAAVFVGWASAGRQPAHPGLSFELGMACAAASLLGFAIVGAQLPGLMKLDAGWARGYRTLGSIE
jgi:hypothetical protein